MLLYERKCDPQNKSFSGVLEIFDVFGIPFMPISCSHIFFWISHGFSPLGYNQVKTTMLQGYVYDFNFHIKMIVLIFIKIEIIPCFIE